MMGPRKEAQSALFHDFSPEDHVPQDHLLRSIDRLVDLSRIRGNLAYRWFCRLDLSNRVPDHSTFSKNRHGRFRDSELPRHLFETTVARRISEDLVSGQRLAVEASLIEADANEQHSTPKGD